MRLFRRPEEVLGECWREPHMLHFPHFKWLVQIFQWTQSSCMLSMFLYFFSDMSNSSSGTADVTMEEAVEFLSHKDEMYQYCGASCIQHNTFVDDKAKEEVVFLVIYSFYPRITCKFIESLRRKEEVDRIYFPAKMIILSLSPHPTSIQTVLLMYLSGFLWGSLIKISFFRNMKTCRM